MIDILDSIRTNATDLDTVLNKIVHAAASLCEAGASAMWLVHGNALKGRAATVTDPRWMEFFKSRDRPLDGTSYLARSVQTGEAANIANTALDPLTKNSDYEQLMGPRALLVVPLKGNDGPIGTFGFARSTDRPFSDEDRELASLFASQAVVAVENSKLLASLNDRTRELDEALRQQTATAKVLDAVSRSTLDLEFVLNALVKAAVELCGAVRGTIWMCGEDGLYRMTAFHNLTDAQVAAFKAQPLAPSEKLIVPRVALIGEAVQVPDTAAVELAEFATFVSRAHCAVPMKRDGSVEGVFVIGRDHTGPFAERQLELLRIFADRALIAVENTRLFSALDRRSRELAESLEYQKAISNVLAAISRSPGSIAPVCDAIAETAMQLCLALDATVLLREGASLRLTAYRGGLKFDAVHLPLDRSYVAGRSVVDGATIQCEDLLAAAAEYPLGVELARRMGFRTAMAVPLLRDGVSIGCILVRRSDVQPFAARQIELLRTLADQAVIAIRNVQLFEEVQARTTALQESLEYQTATSRVLGVISRSPSDVAPVLDAIAATALELCDAVDCTVRIRSGDVLRFGAHCGVHRFHGGDLPLTRDYTAGRAVVDAMPIQVEDLLAAGEEFPRGFQLAVELGFRTAMAVPLMRDGAAIGCILMRRNKVEPFTPRQIELLRTFADQAVIAIANSRLFEEVQAKTRELETSLAELTAAQARLIQSEKLASLGQLTAGIAHEIKNPLNFVNNFADLSVDLVDELEVALAPAGAVLAPKIRDDIADVSNTLKANLAKIVQHGRRADSIVRNMLAHSRSGGGERRRIEVNALVEEALGLAYHGARADKPGFNVTLERDYDPATGEAELFTQEITRVLLNLIGNGFYAVAKRAATGVADYEPRLTVSTRARGDGVEIRVRDNGTGISAETRTKLFTPFFTTKPTGEGTGLGLSLSHDIVVQQHRGTIDVRSELGVFSEFAVVLPRRAPSEGK
ncbi:MAG: GAF domain-containing protein [Azospirillum sp.]|nr:GAF domain-containing protein [Azospirillum sp.]